MENVNLESVIQQTIARFKQNRSGEKPLVFVSVSPSIAQIAWSDGSLKEFVRLFVYECLHSSDPDKTIEVLLTRRAEIGDVNDFVGLHPSYWVQLRLSGRGLKYNESMIENIFRGLGYSCEEWVGVDNSEIRLGIFGTKFNPAAKMLLCLNSVRGTLKCDLLLPVSEYAPLPNVAARTRTPSRHEFN
jgi:hypothetical protein